VPLRSSDPHRVKAARVGVARARRMGEFARPLWRLILISNLKTFGGLALLI
jgi:hypothetical protein